MNELDTEHLMMVVGAVTQNWGKGQAVWKASTKWKGGFKIETCSRDFTLLADEPRCCAGLYRHEIGTLGGRKLSRLVVIQTILEV